jgi:gluconokinase
LRVQARAGSHFFSAGLVDSQFATLQDPRLEAGVLRLDALLPPAQLLALVLDWVRQIQASQSSKDSQDSPEISP